MNKALMNKNDALDAISLAGVLILAGGLSTRMGSPKALLTLPSGDTLLDYHVHHASTLGVPIVIADNEQGFKPTYNEVNNEAKLDKALTVSHVPDYQPKPAGDETNNAQCEKLAKRKHSAGPLGAILAGMQHIIESGAKPSQWLMVISCDSLISAKDVWQCIGNTLDSVGASDMSVVQSYCLTDEERLYPLLGLYQLELTPKLQRYLDSGERRVMRFIQPFCKSIAMPVSWHTLSNLNTPEQFERAIQQL